MPSLAHLLRASSSRGAPFGARAACAIAAQVCAQLERPHGAVAPSAVLVDWDGSVALERSGHAPSSALPYMAPERLAGAEPDARSDVHAVAMVLLELVTGRPARSASDLTFAGDFPVELVELLERSSSPDRNRRHSSPREMGAWLALAEEECGGAMSREELAGWLTERFGGEGAPVARPISVVAGRRWRLGAAAGLLALVGAGAALVARPLVGGSGDEASAAAMVVDGIGARPLIPTAAAMSSSTPEAMPGTMPAPTAPAPTAPDAVSPSMSSGSTEPGRTASDGVAMSVGGSATARPTSRAATAADGSDSARGKARRKRSRAARRASADAALSAAAAADAMKAPATAPAASCPMSQAPSNTMAPVGKDRMAPVGKDAMAPVAK